jgi:hypothetical protein
MKEAGWQSALANDARPNAGWPSRPAGRLCLAARLDSWMNQDDGRRLCGVSNGALVARMAGSISVAIAAAAGIVVFADDLNQRTRIAAYAAATVAVLVAITFAIVRRLKRFK